MVKYISPDENSQGKALPDIEGPGSGFTVIVTESDLIHPFELVSVIVKVVVVVGATSGFAEAEVNPEGELVQE